METEVDEKWAVTEGFNSDSVITLQISDFPSFISRLFIAAAFLSENKMISLRQYNARNNRFGQTFAEAWWAWLTIAEFHCGFSLLFFSPLVHLFICSSKCARGGEVVSKMRWLDKSSLYGAGWNHFLTHEGIGRKKTHKRAPSCLQTLRCLQGQDLPLCASLCLCYNHMDLLANMIHWDMCEYVCVCPCVPVCLGYRRSFAIDCVFCQISFARTKQRSYDACLASRLHIQFI